MEFEDVLEQVGEYGKYQKRLVWVYLIPSSSILPWFCMNFVFLLSIPNHWCHVPELSNSDLTPLQTQSLMKDNCFQYNVNYSAVLDSLEYYDNGTVRSEIIEDAKGLGNSSLYCPSGWDFDKTNYEETATTKWSLVCNDLSYSSLAFTLWIVGSALGTPLYGFISDKFGRRITFYLTVVICLISGISAVLVHSFTAFLILRIINGTLMPSVFQLPYIILIELVGAAQRSHMAGIACITWTLGLSILPLIAYLCRHWVTLGLVTSIVPVFFFGYWKFLPESPRWLITQGRTKEATEILTKIGKVNGKETKDVGTHVEKLAKVFKEGKNQNVDFWEVIRYPRLRRNVLIICISWIAVSMTYQALILNIINLGGNEFLNFFFTSIVELPSYISGWYIMNKFGRRWACSGFFLLTAIACFLPVIVPKEVTVIGVVASVIGKYGCSAAFMVVYQQAAEVIPTPLRAQGMAFSAMTSSLVGISMPYIVFLSIYGAYIPFLVVSLLCLMSSAVITLLPETLNQALPQTIEDGEEFGKDQKFWSYKMAKRKSLVNPEGIIQFNKEHLENSTKA